MDRGLSRRGFLRSLGSLAMVSLLAACQQAPAPIIPTVAPAGPAVVPTPASAAAQPQTATTKQPGADAAPIKRGGQLRMLQVNDFVSMDPILLSGPTARACYDWLVAWRPNAQGVFEIQPMLASAWETTGNTLVFKLREGIKFHDGSDLNAEVVAWNVRRMVQHPKSFAALVLPAIDKQNPAQVLGPMTVQVNLSRPSVGVLSMLSDANNRTGIVSKKAADEHGEEWLNNNPVGTGPYKFVSWAPGDRLVVQRNQDYWQQGQDGIALPYADGITYRVITEASTQFAEMRAGTAE